MSDEQWKPHPICDTYHFSSLGRVARVKNGAFKIINGTTAGQQRYKAIDMFDSSGNRLRAYVHRTVCELFNGLPTSGALVCRHIDTDKSNNSACNLAWGTTQDNADDGKRAGKSPKGERNPMSRLTSADVKKMRDIRKESGATYKQIAKSFGVSTMTAYRATVGQSWN